MLGEWDEVLPVGQLGKLRATQRVPPGQPTRGPTASRPS